MSRAKPCARLCENFARGNLKNEKGVRITFTENTNAPERKCERRFFSESNGEEFSHSLALQRL